MFIENLDELERKYSKILKEVENYLYSAPDGHIKAYRRGSTFLYYLCEDGESNGAYLQKGSSSGLKKIEQYCQKKYYKMLLPVVSKDLEQIQFLKKKMDDRTIRKIFEDLPEAIRQHVNPIELSDEEYAKKWRQTFYKRNSLPIENLGYQTKNGEQVRSKSELIIANKLYDYDVPYKYEKIYKFGIYGELSPDFTILNKRTRQVYIWEHFGLMGNSEYRERAIRKMGIYLLYAASFGYHFIPTFEDENVSIDTNVLDAIISDDLI